MGRLKYIIIAVPVLAALAAAFFLLRPLLGGQSAPEEATAQGAAAQIAVETVTVARGETSVSVPIYLSDNPGVAGVRISVEYDNALVLTKIARGSALETLEFTPGGDLSANPIRMLWDGLENDSTNGELAVLTFLVPETAGEYGITLACEAGDFCNSATDDVTVALTNGAICVK
ncbi:MAG: hypothetical protein IJT18_05815 [Oscillospiraceae bacterium]|nr:hypothetical protein [Oscillospiraceae bacterium]